MPTPRPSEPWPPPNGIDFVRSNAFGRLLVDIVSDHTRRYPRLDFSDAVAVVFDWFDRKLKQNRRFINARRFPSLRSFQAYLRQAVWNAALQAEKKRQRREQVVPLPIDRFSSPGRVDPAKLDKILESVDALPEPHKTVFHRFFLDEDDPALIAGSLGLSEEEFWAAYEEAIDMLKLS